jgi:hypothetical protein
MDQDVVASGKALVAPQSLSNHGLLAGEDPAGYEQQFAEIRAVVCPKDILEENWLRDVVASSWEVFRLRRAKSEFINSNAHRGVHMVLGPLLGWKEGQELGARWATKEPEAQREVEKILTAAGMSAATIIANTMAALAHEVAQFDRLMTAAAGRRDATLREIALYRTTFAAKLRGAVEEVEVTDFEVLPSAANE